MAGLPDDYRARAKEQVAASAALFEEGDFDSNAKKQALAIIGQVNATVLTGLADVMDYLRQTTGADSAMARRKLILEKNDEIRKAAANGDWKKFDQITGAADPANAGTSVS